MDRRRRLLLGGCALAGLIGAAAVGGAEEVTYSYDALGRLRASSVSGGANDGTNTAICYDAANNRERYVTTVGGAASCTPAPYPAPAPTPTPTPAPTPTPTPTPTPSNQPPVAVTDSTTMGCNAFKVLNLLGNDSDPDSDAISLVSVSPNEGEADTYGTVISGTSIRIDSGQPGFATLYYVIEDVHGAPAYGQVEITITGSWEICIP